MEPSSPQAEESSLTILDSQIRELFARTAYSHKVHEINADIYVRRSKRLKLLQIVLSAITTGTLVAAIFGQGTNPATLIAAVCSAVLLTLNSYLKDYDLGALAQTHSDTAVELWSVRESYLSLITDTAARTLSLDSLQERRDRLQEQLSAIYKTAPRTDRKAYRLAQKALKIDEDLTFSDAEVDVFLPKELQKSPSE